MFIVSEESIKLKPLLSWLGISNKGKFMRALPIEKSSQSSKQFKITDS
jgi:hypothetical protein